MIKLFFCNIRDKKLKNGGNEVKFGMNLLPSKSPTVERLLSIRPWLTIVVDDWLSWPIYG